MDVTDVLRDRRGEPDGLQKMLVASVVAHIAVAALVTGGAHWGWRHHRTAADDHDDFDRRWRRRDRSAAA
jgi:hypothetical protein